MVSLVQTPTADALDTLRSLAGQSKAMAAQMSEVLGGAVTDPSVLYRIQGEALLPKLDSALVETEGEYLRLRMDLRINPPRSSASSAAHELGCCARALHEVLQMRHALAVMDTTFGPSAKTSAFDTVLSLAQLCKQCCDRYVSAEGVSTAT